MDDVSSEVHLREKTKEVLQCIQDGDLPKAKELILTNSQTLKYNLGRINFYSLIPRVRFSKANTIPKNFDALKLLIETGFEIYSNSNNYEELIFFAAAKCEPETLQDCVNRIQVINPEGINETREGDTALMFMVKYGNVTYENYPECVRILVASGVDVNKCDYQNQVPVLFLVHLYDIYKKKQRINYVLTRNLTKSVEYLMDTKRVDITTNSIGGKTTEDLIKEHSLYNLDDYVSFPETAATDPKTLFWLLIKGQEDKFINTKGVKNYDVDDGSNTLLQLAVTKNLKKVVKFLITKKANLMTTTRNNQQFPVEIAARRNYPEIFEILLNNETVVISEALFLTFLRERGRQIKTKYFDELLKSKRLDVNFRSTNGNTPLHYAIIFANTEAILSLLKRGASLMTTNQSGKSALDYINPEDLEVYLNRCVLLDNYYGIFDGKYEVALNCRSLIEVDGEDRVRSEVAVVSKICNSEKLKHLVNHPLLSSYIDLKWKLIEPLYKSLFFFQLFFYALTIVLYFNSNFLLVVGLPLAVLYSFRIALTFNWKENKLHETIDITIVAIMVTSMISNNAGFRQGLGVVLVSFLAVSFHLFWWFHIAFAEIHAIFVNTFSRIVSFFFYIFILLLFFGSATGLYALNQSDGNYADFVDNSKFYVVVVFIIFVFVVLLLTIVNCFVFLQEHAAENIKNNFKIYGYCYVLMFMSRMEKLYGDSNFVLRSALRSAIMVVKGYVFPLGNFGSTLRSPFIFEENSEGTGVSKKMKKHASKNGKSRFFLHFYLNKGHFLAENLIAIKLNDSNIAKIRNFVKNFAPVKN